MLFMQFLIKNTIVLEDILFLCLNNQSVLFLYILKTIYASIQSQ